MEKVPNIEHFKTEYRKMVHELVKIRNQGNLIQTPLGEGVIVKIESYSRLGGFKRYCIETPDGIRCFFEDEIGAPVQRCIDAHHCESGSSNLDVTVGTP